MKCNSECPFWGVRESSWESRIFICKLGGWIVHPPTDFLVEKARISKMKELLGEVTELL